MMGLSIWHVLIFLIIVVLLFGTSKLKNIGKDIGGVVKDFKKSISDESEEKLSDLNTKQIINAEVKTAEQRPTKS